MEMDNNKLPDLISKKEAMELTGIAANVWGYLVQRKVIRYEKKPDGTKGLVTADVIKLAKQVLESSK